MARDVGIVANIRIIEVGDSSIAVAQVVEADGLHGSGGGSHLEIAFACGRDRKGKEGISTRSIDGAEGCRTLEKTRDDRSGEAEVI